MPAPGSSRSSRWWSCATGPRTIPEIRFENAWYLLEESNERAWAETRARAEEAWLAGIELTRSGRRRFERFGRDPGRPLG